VRTTTIKARTLRPGDLLVFEVSRVLGMQGRKPREAAPLMRIEYADGTSEVIREDRMVTVLRD
jgi:hypothetical protein